MRKVFLFVLVSGISLILAACGSQAPPEPLELNIDMTEYAFDPAELVFQVGQDVTLHLSNSGSLEHEIMFGRDVMMTDGRPNGFMVDMFESAGVEPDVTIDESEAGESEEEHMEEMEEGEHAEGDEHTEDEHMEDEHEHAGFMVLVPASHDTYTMEFTVTEDMVGEWEIGCFLLDGVHYTSGMTGSLTVEN